MDYFGKFYRWLWNSNIDNSQVNELTPQGYDDLNEIAMRFRLKYPEVFKNYDPEYYYVSAHHKLYRHVSVICDYLF